MDNKWDESENPYGGSVSRISVPALGRFPRSGNEQPLDSSRRDLRARSRVALSFEENPGARIRAYHEIFPMTKESRCNCVAPSIMLQTLLLWCYFDIGGHEDLLCYFFHRSLGSL